MAASFDYVIYSHKNAIYYDLLAHKIISYILTTGGGGMILKLRLNKNHEKEISEELIHMGVTISEDSELILTEEHYNNGKIYCRDDTDTVAVNFEEILYIESVGKNVYVHTDNKIYTTSIRLYKLEKELPEISFLRISNSIIIRRDSIKKVKPALSQKFYLILKNGDTVDVTRTYYYKFKECYGI